MLTRGQKRLWKYIEEGSLMKLKSYLRKHRDLDVNFSQGKRQRSPLQLACSLGDDAVVRLLLEHGADVLRVDRKGDTALHVAVNRALKHGKTAYDDLVVPLRKNCPEAMHASNYAGVTPQDLLDGLKHSEPSRSGTSGPSRADPEKDWLEKLFGECEDEFYETFGVYDDDYLPVDDDEEDYGDWADRIRREYFAKKHAEAQKMAASSSGGRKKKTKREDGESYKELHARLQKEHEEYLSRAARKEEETRQGKKRRYEQMCANTFNSGAVELLSYADIPWPAPRGTVQEMVDVMLHGVDRKDATAFRKALRQQQALWHPDKFAQRCEARLDGKDKQRILDTVTALSQELNRLAQSLKK
ncbi:NF-kappa-B inhibitor-like protein 1 isoform X1 [Corythoichthys intestinalis]|uniref:NF-kappa-B inhibitor-like protein 1 isoform X1 n=1 Tax=Corythoichthys intestinalis TaxID=161448 RepID=UPI0025A5AD0D|nr:NF-kappa-B inhibitor-like protein 1 isoform X1 [Corythoichthys intestinalis]